MKDLNYFFSSIDHSNRFKIIESLDMYVRSELALLGRFSDLNSTHDILDNYSVRISSLVDVQYFIDYLKYLDSQIEKDSVNDLVDVDNLE